MKKYLVLEIWKQPDGTCSTRVHYEFDNVKEAKFLTRKLNEYRRDNIFYKTTNITFPKF